VFFARSNLPAYEEIASQKLLAMTLTICIHFQKRTYIKITLLEFGGSMTTQRQALRRSRNNRMLAGVCGGLAEFFGVSSFWFRLAFLIALIPGGVPGILVYLIMMMIVPSE
jgi:phage shock protein C